MWIRSERRYYREFYAFSVITSDKKWQITVKEGGVAIERLGDP
jgi:hypothetical protein